VTVSAGAACTASASIDNGSSDPDGEAVTLAQSPPGPYSLGDTSVTLTVTDTLNVSATCTGKVTVVDTTPPVVTSTVATSLLWPPSHDLQNVGLAASVTDNCPGASISVKGIFSNEPDLGPDADSNFSPDATNIGLGTLRLRSERPGSGQRIYLDVVQATDGSGNVSYSCTAVVVPGNQSAAGKAAVEAAAASALAYCNSHNGTVPPGYVPVGSGPLIGPKQ